MNRQKAMMDALMGASRNQKASDRLNDDFLDDKVCKPFLVGFCPDQLLGWQMDKERERDVFAYSKRPEMPQTCKNTHSKELKMMFESHPKYDQYKKEYEIKLVRRLDEIVKDSDRFAANEKRKCRQKEDITRLTDKEKEEIEGWKVDHKEQIGLARQKGEKGDVDGSQECVLNARGIQDMIDGKVDRASIYFPGEECCMLCGCRYLSGEMPEIQRGLAGYHWLAGHNATKLHQSYKEVRDKLVELGSKIKTPSTEHAASKERSRERSVQRGDREKESSPPKNGRGGKRDKSCSKRSDSRGNRKSRSRHAGRGRDTGRSRDDRRDSRSRSRGKKQGRNKGRNKSQSRSRSRAGRSRADAGRGGGSRR